MRSTHYRLSAACVLASALLIGCGGGGGGGGGGPQGLHLTRVITENGAARGAKIGPAGGTITATGSNGVVYTLTIPPLALKQDTQIGVYPVSSLKGVLPAGKAISAGVHFTPDGLLVSYAPTLKMELP